jgi:glycosyltransferase involved in cell wall biosynthesis
MKLSIIIPVYNSEKIISLLIKLIHKNLKNKIYPFEIILINDFSRDRSWEKINHLVKKYNFVKGINLNQNYGQHSAIFVGLRYSKGKNIICLDDDMQHDPFYINDIYNQLEKGHDVCYVKYINRQHSKIKIFVSWLNNFISSYLMEKSSKIYTSSFKGFNSKIKKKIIIKSSKFIFLDYWIIKNSKNLKIINIKHKKRIKGETNYNFRELITLWSKMFFIIDTKKFSLRFLIITIFRFLFKTFFKDYVKIDNNKTIIVSKKTFKC